MENKPIISHWQKYFSRIHYVVSLAYEFKGKIDIKIMEEAVQLVYKHFSLYNYHIPDVHEYPLDNDFEKCSEEFLQEREKQTKFVHLDQVKNVKEELDFLHKSSREQLKYNNKLLPLKLIVLSGYSDNEFALLFTFDHLYLDGTGMTYTVNEILTIYSKLLRQESVDSHIKSLQQRKCISTQEMAKKYNPISFWQQFINTIRTSRPKFGDPANISVDAKKAFEIYKNEYEEVFERDCKKQFQIIENFDFSHIFNGVRKTHPQVSKNSIINAIWFRFFDHYNTTIRAKELDVDPETLRGLSSSAIAYRNIPYEEYANLTGNYLASVNISYDQRKFSSLEQFSLQIHEDTQRNKKAKLGVTNELMNSPLFSNHESLQGFFDLNLKSIYLSSSWTNYALNQNTKMMEGAEYFRTSQGYTNGINAGKKYFPNAFVPANGLIQNCGPNNSVCFTYQSMNYERNVQIMHHFEQYIKEQNQFYANQETAI